MWNQLKMLIAGLGRDESGQTLVEYALIIALVAVALVAALGALQGNIGSAFTSIGNTLAGA